MNVTRTLDVGLCLEVLTNKDIFESISEDTATHDNLIVDVINDYWLKVEVDQDIIGVVKFKQMFSKCWDCHIHILPKHRSHSMSAGKAILNWCKENLHGSLLYTNVPEFCPNVKSFLMKFGFTEQGVLHRAWLKNGKLNNMTILTREV